ncbi:MAG: 6-pyruvoyl tetrahydropterin synthase family protein, partial [Pseudomonadales bacterium]
MQRMTTIEIRKQYLHFSAAHFTIFSATERERLHGHNWRVSASITGPVQFDGLCFDYAVYKELLKKLCAQYDEYTLLPEFSPYLTIEEQGDIWLVTHNEIAMSFLKTDVLVLPVRNITIEELSDYLLNELLKSKETLDQHEISHIQLGVSSGPD